MEQQQGKPQAQVREYNPIDEMSKAIRCLALELPEPVWKDVNDRWQKVVKSIPTEVQKEEWISVQEYEQLVLKLLVDKPVIEAMTRKNIPFNRWHSNVHYLVDKALGAVREVRVKIPSSAPPISHKEDERD